MELPSYPNEGTMRSEFPTMECRVYDALEGATADPHGILRAAFTTPQEFQDFVGHPAGENHELLTQPEPLGLNPTAVQGQQYTASVTRYLEQQKAIKQFKTALLKSLNEEARSLIAEPPPHGMRRRSIQFILATLRSAYGTLTAADLVQMKMQLQESYSPATPIRDYIRKHRNVHNVCAAADQAMPEADKVQALRRGVKHVPLMHTATQHFVTTYPTVAAQSFELLATLLGQAEDNGEPEPTTGTAGYAAATIPSSTTLADLETMVKELRQELRQLTTGNHTLSQPTLPPQPKKYCWTHGACGHTSTDCNYPATGHVPNATATNRQGGALNQSKYNKK